MWLLTISFWLAFIIPGFSGRTAKDDSRPAVLPVQAKIQIIAAGKLLRLQDSGFLPPERSRGLDGAALDMLDGVMEENGPSQYVVCHKALLFMRHGDYRQAQKQLETIIKPDKSLAAIIQASLSTCRAGGGQITPPPETVESQMLQEAVNRELKDYWQTIARREMAGYAGLESPVPGLDAGELRRLKRDIFWIAVTSSVMIINFFVCLVRLFGPDRTADDAADGAAGSCPPVKLDPLKVCAAYVFLQWLMVLLAIALSRVFAFKGYQVTSVFCTYTCTYTVLIAALVHILPHLRDNSGGEDGKVQFSVPEFLQLGRICRRDWRWGWIGFSTSMTAAFLIAQITAVCSGHSPHSENPLLGVAAQSRPSEWLLLILQLSFCGPLFEELVFRGLLFKGLRSCWPAVCAAVFSAALFGITHFDPQGTFVLAGLGLCFALVYHKSGSLWPAVIAHGLWNGFVAFNLLMAVS